MSNPEGRKVSAEDVVLATKDTEISATKRFILLVGGPCQIALGITTVVGGVLALTAETLHGIPSVWGIPMIASGFTASHVGLAGFVRGLKE